MAPAEFMTVEIAPELRLDCHSTLLGEKENEQRGQNCELEDNNRRLKSGHGLTHFLFSSNLHSHFPPSSHVTIAGRLHQTISPL